MNKTFDFWIKSSEYDLKTAQELFKIKRYPYSLYFCHLALEKILKALMVKQTGKHAAFTHNLVLLAEKSNLILSDKQKDFLAEVTDFNIEARYPDEKMVFYKKCNKKYTENYLNRTKGVYKWLKNQLSK